MPLDSRTSRLVARLLQALCAALLGAHAAGALAAEAAETWLGLPISFVERSWTFNPWPAVELKAVKIHTADPIQITRAWVRPDWAAWIRGSNTNRIRVEAEEISARPAALARLGLSDGKSTRVITKMSFQRLRLKFEGRELVLPEGEMEFGADGTMSHMRLKHGDVSVDATPKDGGMRLLLQMNSWRWDVLPGLRFESVVAQGALTETGIFLDKLGAVADGGAVNGTLRLDIGAQYIVDADLRLSNLRAHDVLERLRPKNTVTGTLASELKLTAMADDFAGLQAAAEAKGTFTITEGAIDRMGLLSGMKRDYPGPAGGGNTRFDKLTGSFAAKTNQAATLTIQRLDGGVLQGSGSLVSMPDGAIKGGMLGSLRLPNGEVLSRGFSLSGKVDAPVLSARQ